MKYNHLPHIDISNYYQFITFRTHDSIDGFIKKLVSQHMPNNKKQMTVDTYLDRSHNGAYLHGDVVLFLSEFFISKEGILYELIAFSIMPNHIHLLILPLKPLPFIMQSIKGASAKIINEMLGKGGKFWASDYYDKAVRDEKHFVLVYEYIKNNPLKLSEAKPSSSRFYGIYEGE
ncbi:MAG: hypothetical protein GQ583_08650 [Methyloprofundus sp.]|nr:hypothetical protein [Methyloprofundus sp.]